MEEDIHRKLAEELDYLIEPPIGDLVSTAVRRGDRQRVARRLQLGAATLAAVGIVGLGTTLAVSNQHAPQTSPVATVTTAGAQTTVPEATVRQRRANEAKDGDPRNPAAWGPAQIESAQVAARGAYDRAGVTTWVAAQREGTTDRYQITLRSRTGGTEYLIEVDYLTWTVLSVSPR